MNARLRMYKYCYSNKGAIYAVLLPKKVTPGLGSSLKNRVV